MGTLATLKVAKPTFIGVPAAPNILATLFPNRPTTNALKGDNPIPTKRGIATAAGIPKPEVPSKKASKNQAIKITWTR
ncbi:MAG: hypothetical protein BWY03_00634 [Parcubacteria group bacterium ADurb.Bin159]|nr:MAG: hypothetical protein BWY03_00634 [Parcubacteria group bacterium ADurb.Bin159]